MSTPRLFLARHGETAWTLTGQHTGITDLPLTDHGEFQVASSRAALIGPGRLIDPYRLSHIYVSPRLRARRTLKLLLASESPVPDERVREWEYGRYEGMTPAQIREDRLARGLDTERPFNIWRDGCEDASDGIGVGHGESKQEITARIDGVIEEVRGIHRAGLAAGKDNVDVLIVSHGHFLRSLAKRWLGLEVDANLSMVLEPGGIATMTYTHRNIDEPAFVLGGVFRAGEEEAGGEQCD